MYLYLLLFALCVGSGGGGDVSKRENTQGAAVKCSIIKSESKQITYEKGPFFFPKKKLIKSILYTRKI